MNIKILMIILGIIAVICIGAIIAVFKHTDRNEEFVEAQKKKDTKNRLYLLTKIYKATPVIKRYFIQLKDKYRSLFPADEITIETMATKQMTKCLGVAVAIIVAMLFICKGDIPYMLVALVGAYIIFTNMMNSSADSIEIKLSEQLSTFIDDLTAYYHDTHDIVEAVGNTLDDLPYEISLHAQRINQIVTSTNPSVELEDYIGVAPNRFLLLTAAVCSSIKEYGDKEIDGKSLFLLNLNYIKEELNQERLYLASKKDAYAGKVAGCVIPLFMFKLAEGFITKSIVETQSFFKGSLGTIVMVVILLIDITCYELINISKNTGKYSNEVIEPNPKLKKLSEISFIKKILTLQQTKNYTGSIETARQLQGTSSADDINTYTIKRWLWAIAMFILVNVTCIYSTYRGKEYKVSDFTTAYSQELVPNESYRNSMKEASERLYGRALKSEDIGAEVTAYVLENDLDKTMVSTITEELTRRAEEYKKYHYTWLMLLISLGGMVLGYFIPYFLLKTKSKVMEMKRQDEVTQFKTLIMIFMHMDGMMLNDVLTWMQRFSNIYKPALSVCIMNFESGQQNALQEMKDAESGFAPFRRLCDSLLAVDIVGIENAFDALESDRDFDIKKREQDQTRLLKKEADKAEMYMSIPIYALIIGFILLPFIVYGLNMLSDFAGVL